jgi:undecaprenyl-diphosphatase
MSSDQSLIIWINQGWASPFLDWLLSWVSDKYSFSFPLLLLLLWTAVSRELSAGLRWWLALILMVALGDALGAQLKDLFAQARPCFSFFEPLRLIEGGQCGASLKGMPSNHALNSFAATAFLFVTRPAWKGWRLFMLVSAILVALSRIYLAKHFPSQVVMGAAIGTLWGLAAACLYDRIRCRGSD